MSCRTHGLENISARRSGSAVSMFSLAFLLSCTACIAQEKDDPVTYANLEREYGSSFVAGRLESNFLASSTALQAGSYGSMPVLSVQNCSDERYRCIRWSTSLAVPRSGLRKGQIYEVMGNVFKVEECRYELDGVCGVALVGARCVFEDSKDPDNPYPSCVAPRSAGSRKPSWYTYFTYNRNIGITAFGQSLKEPLSQAEKIAVMTQNILSTPMGLLHPEKEISRVR